MKRTNEENKKRMTTRKEDEVSRKIKTREKSHVSYLCPRFFYQYLKGKTALPLVRPRTSINRTAGNDVNNNDTLPTRHGCTARMESGLEQQNQPAPSFRVKHRQCEIA